VWLAWLRAFCCIRADGCIVAPLCAPVNTGTVARHSQWATPTLII
jgi:hypothetical protein